MMFKQEKKGEFADDEEENDEDLMRFWVRSCSVIL